MFYTYAKLVEVMVEEEGLKLGLFIGRQLRFAVADLFIGGRYFSRRARALVRLAMSWPAATARAHPNLAREGHEPRCSHGVRNGYFPGSSRMARVGGDKDVVKLWWVCSSVQYLIHSGWGKAVVVNSSCVRRRGIRIVVLREEDEDDDQAPLVREWGRRQRLVPHWAARPGRPKRKRGGRRAHSGWAGGSGPMRKKWRRQRWAVVAGQEEEGEGRIEPEGLFYL